MKTIEQDRMADMVGQGKIGLRDATEKVNGGLIALTPPDKLASVLSETDLPVVIIREDTQPASGKTESEATSNP